MQDSILWAIANNWEQYLCDTGDMAKSYIRLYWYDVLDFTVSQMAI